jgi:hypothetical protein
MGKLAGALPILWLYAKVRDALFKLKDIEYHIFKASPIRGDCVPSSHCYQRLDWISQTREVRRT